MTEQTFTLNEWRLDDLFPSHSGPEMKGALTGLESQVADFEKRRAELDPEISTGAFLDILAQLEDISRQASHIQAFAHLWYSENTQGQAAQTFLAQVEQTMAGLNNRTLFFELWWKELEDGPAARLVAVAGDMAYWLEQLRLFKPHTLSEPEEKIINIKDVTGASALRTLYSSITNRYVFRLEVNGEVKELSREGLMSYVYNPNPDLRAAAYQELYRVYAEDGPILGQMYQNMTRDWRNENLDLRKFSSPMAVRNLSNDIPDTAVDTLLQVSRDNAGIFQRYFRLKARWLGMEKLRRYDIYAPVAAADKEYPYPQAVSMVLESFQSFTPRLAELARRVFAEDHIDSVERKGKRSGAFCMSPDPRLTPWVLINYQHRARDVATLAHELGHAIHTMLASDHSLFTFHASLPMAETASTFAEMILVDRLLAEEQDEAVRRDLLFRQVDDSYATIMRQVYFALFERQAHEMVHQGASVDDLCEAYMENLQEQFSTALELKDEFRWEWVSIPHIYQYPFYVYAYAFGQLLVLSLYERYKREGEAFKPYYMSILEAGGSAAPARILEEAGVDIHSAEFWQGGFNVLARLVDELEALPVEVVNS